MDNQKIYITNNVLLFRALLQCKKIMIQVWLFEVIILFVLYVKILKGLRSTSLCIVKNVLNIVQKLL